MHSAPHFIHAFSPETIGSGTKSVSSTNGKKQAALVVYGCLKPRPEAIAMMRIVLMTAQDAGYFDLMVRITKKHQLKNISFYSPIDHENATPITNQN
jgi:hypothetical protein